MKELNTLLAHTINLEDLIKNPNKIIEDISLNKNPKILLHENEAKVILLSIDEYLKFTSTDEKTSSEVIENKETTNDHNIKIGSLVKDTFEYFEKNNLLQEAMIEKLSDEEYCSSHFGISYRLLKKVDTTIPLKEQVTEGTNKKYMRYWRKPLEFHNTQYLICSQWYDRHRERFVKWCKINYAIDPYNLY